MKLVAKSYQRYNGGVRAKRRYGSSTITRFYVYREQDAADPSKWVSVEVGGPSPGERATAAKQQGEQVLRSKGLEGWRGRTHRFSGVEPRKKRALLFMGAGAAAIAIAGIVYSGTRPGGFLRTLPAVPGLDPYFVQLAAKWAGYYGVPLQWVLATILAESGGNPNSVGDKHIIPEGASIGLMQVNTVAHASELAAAGIPRGQPGQAGSIFDPNINIQWGVKIFRKCMDRVQSALAGRSGDVGLLTRLCYTGVNTPSTIVAGGDPYSCPSCPTTGKNWGDRLAQTAAAA